MAHTRRTRLVCSACLALATALFSINPAAAAVERIGNAIQIVQTVTGEIQANFRYLILEDPVYQDEVIATKPGSASRIVFRDNTELQVGPEARVTLDDFVFDPDPSVARFVISAFDGVLRFATGKLAKDAYQIETPTAIIGVRGTTFASIFGPDGQQVILLEDGIAVTIQDRNGGPLHTLSQPGLSVTVRPDGSVSDPEPAPQWAQEKLRELNALLLTLDELVRGEHFDEDDPEPLPIIEEAALPQPTPPPPAAVATPKAKPKHLRKPHKHHVQAQPHSEPKHRETKRASHRSDIRIERRSRKVHVRVERDERHHQANNHQHQLEARAPSRDTTNKSGNNHREQRTAHNNNRSDKAHSRDRGKKNQEAHSRSSNNGRQRDGHNNRSERSSRSNDNKSRESRNHGHDNHASNDRGRNHQGRGNNRQHR